MESEDTKEDAGTKLKLQFMTSDELWSKVIKYKIDAGLKNNSLAVQELIKKALESTDKKEIISDQEIPDDTYSQIIEFREKVPTYERKHQLQIPIFLDKKSGAFYCEVHLSATELVPLSDPEATVDPELQKEYRSNRELEPNNPYFIQMIEDAKGGRQFSDLVVEYNTEYKATKPLKILGGQHRHNAIELALKEGVEATHGIRVFFNLDKDQRAEIMRIANTNIKVAEDLRDRIEEQKLSPANLLRNYCQDTGILESGEDFGDKRRFEEEFSPTVRMMRSFIVNFYKGKEYKGDVDKSAVEPELVETGGSKVDHRYLAIFNKFKDTGFKDKDLVAAGKAFAKLHNAQFERSDKIKGGAKKQFKVRAFSDSVITAWAFASGVLQRDSKRLEKLYNMPELSGIDDPLNAYALSRVKIKNDPTYRGLAVRSNERERGRMLKLLLLYTQSSKYNKINEALCNAAIKSFDSNKSYIDSEKQENEVL